MLLPRTCVAVASALCALALCACGGGPPRSSDLPPVTPIMQPPAMAATAADDLIGGAWRWQPSAGETSDRYTIEFLPDGRVQVRADCNRGAGRYTADPAGRMTLTAIALTKMSCPAGSLDARFAHELAEVEGYRAGGDALDLTQKGGGRMTFRR